MCLDADVCGNRQCFTLDILLAAVGEANAASFSWLPDNLDEMGIPQGDQRVLLSALKAVFDSKSVFDSEEEKRNTTQRSQHSPDDNAHHQAVVGGVDIEDNESHEHKNWPTADGFWNPTGLFGFGLNSESQHSPGSL